LGGPLDDSHECGFMVEEADEVRPVKIVPYLRQVVCRPGLFYQISRPFCRNHGFTLPSLEKSARAGPAGKIFVYCFDPHRGSPVADLILGLIPGIDSGPIKCVLDHFALIGSGAFEDLSTKAALTFNPENADVAGVRYLSYFGTGHISLALMVAFAL
jgi:hypothetical protein